MGELAKLIVSIVGDISGFKTALREGETTVSGFASGLGSKFDQPKPDSPVLVTTNFSITYFAVANEVEGSGLPAWLVVTDAEGMSVLTAWAAGKFDAERIAKAIKGFNVADKVSRKRIVLPGHVAVLSGEAEEELPGWEVRVGPREAVDLPAFMKQFLN